MKSKNRYNLLYDIGFIIITISFITISVILYLDNNRLETQLIKSEALIDEIILQDSINSESKSSSDKIIEKYINDCNILINGKEISPEDLVVFMNKQQKTNQELSDSLSIYRSYIDLTKKNFDVDFSVSKYKNKYVTKISTSTDSIQLYKDLYNNLKTVIKKNYGIEYQVQSDNSGMKFIKEPTKIDTIMMFYDKIIFKETKNKIKIRLR